MSQSSTFFTIFQQFKQVAVSRLKKDEIVKKSKILVKKLLIFSQLQCKTKVNKTGVINDPFGQTHSHASSEHCFRFKVVLF